MLLNPYQVPLSVIPGTRMLQESFGLAGVQITDPVNPSRLWTIETLYSPIQKRKLSGLRAKLVDQKGFVTFCNQRDLELLLGLAKAGQWCIWAAQEYPDIGEDGWFGFCMDADDQYDDLYERELVLMAEHPNGLDWSTTEITRHLHTDEREDIEDLWIADMGSLFHPLSRETLQHRWIRVSRDRIEWWRIQ